MIEDLPEAMKPVLDALTGWPDSAEADELDRLVRSLDAATAARSASVQRLIEALDEASNVATALPELVEQALDSLRSEITAAISDGVDRVRAQAESVAQGIHELAALPPDDVEVILADAEGKVDSAADSLDALTEGLLGQADRALDALQQLEETIDRGIGGIAALIAKLDDALQPIRPLVDQMEALA